MQCPEISANGELNSEFMHVTGNFWVGFFFGFSRLDQRTSSQITDRIAPGAFYYLAVPK